MHKNADIDAFSSAYYLSEIFGDVVIVSDGLDKYVKNIVRKENLDVRDNIDFDYNEVITVDTASREQLGKFSNLKIDVVYDHHESNNIDAKERYVDSSYPSCAEMVYDIHKKKPSRLAALLLLAGIISDTLWFKHANRRTLQIFYEIMNTYDIEFSEIRNMVDMSITFSERISVLKGFQRVIYRSYGNKIAAATKVSANESIVATELISFADIVFVGSARKNEIRVIGRSKEANLLDIFRELSQDFSCKYGGHKNAAGMSCIGELEAILNAALIISAKYLEG